MKVKFLKITKVTMSNFRCHQNATINADDMTVITGENGKGKSSISHAISYALYGLSAFGVQDIDNIRAENSYTVSVTLEFVDENNQLHIFNRTRKKDSTTLTLNSNLVTQKQKRKYMR